MTWTPFEPADPFGRGRLVGDVDERLVGIGRAQRLERIARAGRLAVAGREDAAGHRREVRREQHRAAQRHFHLSRVTVIEQPIGREASVDRAEAGRFLGFAAGAADARGGVDDQAVRLDQPGIDQGLQREDRRSRVAARGRDRLRAADRLAIELGNAVDELAEQLRRLVRMAVPALVGRGVVEPEVGAEIDERDAAIEDCAGEPLAVPVRQSGEDEVDAVEIASSKLLDAASG